MGVAAGIISPKSLDSALVSRLTNLGIDPVPSTTGLPPSSESCLATALALAVRDDRLLVIVDSGPDRPRWRQEAVAMLGPLESIGADLPFVALFLPAASQPKAGPVAILSPSGTASAYEVLLGGALAAMSDRRVEHLNARGEAASATRSRSTGLAAARTAVSGWRELAVTRPERAMHKLITRPALIVAAVPPGGVDAGAVIAGHPDADVVLVIDTAHRRHGARTATQVASMVELAFGIEASAPTAPQDSPHAPEEQAETGIESAQFSPSTAPAYRVRASDLVHVRLTSTAVELTNRTALHLRLKVDLGSADDPTRVVARLGSVLAPGEQQVVPTDHVAALAELDSPTAVLRHWSHDDTEVFEGGQRRLLGVELTVLDERGEPLVQRAFDVGNGFDFAATGRVLLDLLGESTPTSVLPEPVAPSTSANACEDLLMALSEAAGTGAQVLARRSNA